MLKRGECLLSFSSRGASSQPSDEDFVFIYSFRKKQKHKPPLGLTL